MSKMKAAASSAGKEELGDARALNAGINAASTRSNTTAVTKSEKVSIVDAK